MPIQKTGWLIVYGEPVWVLEGHIIYIYIERPLWTQQVVLAIAVAIIYGLSSVIWAGMMRKQCWIKNHRFGKYMDFPEYEQKLYTFSDM